MNASARRIRLLVGVMVAAFLLVALGLVEVMVLDHDRWLAHSYANRWSFRDVPAERGPILDAHGRLLVSDQPALCLQVVPRQFLDAHPVGLVLAAAALVAPQRQLELRDGAEAARAAWSLAWHAPLATPEAQKAWRVVWYRLGRALDAPRAELQTLLDALRAQPGAAVGPLLPPERAEAWREQFELRLQELERLDRELANSTGRGLWSGLEAALREPAMHDRLHTPWPRIPHGLGSYLAVHARAHAGLIPGHSVERALQADPICRTLPLLLGRVRGVWAEDSTEPRTEALLDPFLDELAEQEELFGESVVERARSRVAGVAQALALQSRVGASGIEAAADHVLAGRAGLRWVDRDSDARELRLWSALEAAPGRPVETTIDLDLQRLVERLIDAAPPDGAHERALALIDLTSGEVLALVGRSGEDASPAASWWGGNGALGSIVKPFVLLGWLQARDAGPAEGFAPMEPCAGRLLRSGSGRRVLRCDHVHGSIGTDPVQAVAQSCNVFFYQAAQQLGMERLEQAYAQFGLAAVDAARHHRRVSGLMPFASPRLEAAGQVLETMAIGYGVSAATVSVARAYAALATNVLPEVRLWRDGAAPLHQPLGARVEHLALVQAGLRACVVEGTAQLRTNRPPELARLAEYQVHGKTGTAGIRGADGEERNNAWFAGWVPPRAGARGFAFATVAYATRDRLHGAEIAGALIGRLLERIAADPVLAARYLPPEVR